jgi:hypothetical protein
MPSSKQADTEILAAAVIAAGMYANPKSGDWIIEEIANVTTPSQHRTKNPND